MPAVVPRGRGRPKRGSGKVNGPIKVVKPQAPVRRSTRGKAATTGHVDEDGDGEVQADEIEADNHASPAPDASSAEYSAWEIERQIMREEVQELKEKHLTLEDKCSNLKEDLRKAQDAFDRAINASEDDIMDLRMRNSKLLERAEKAEARNAELEGQVEVLRCGQTRHSAAASSSRPRPGPPATSSRPPRPASPDPFDSSGEDEATPYRSQPASSAMRTPRKKKEPQSRTAWDTRDVNLLVNLIKKFGPYYSQIERIWTSDFPDRHPRDQGQIKDKARNLKVYYLKKDERLPSQFDKVQIDAKGVAQIKAVGRNPYRRESDLDEYGKPINIYFDEERERNQ